MPLFVRRAVVTISSVVCVGVDGFYLVDGAVVCNAVDVFLHVVYVPTACGKIVAVCRCAYAEIAFVCPIGTIVARTERRNRRISKFGKVAYFVLFVFGESKAVDKRVYMVR